MNIACSFLVSALTLAQPTSRSEWQLAPQLSAGLELVYAGSYTDEKLIPNVRYQQQYRLQTYVFVLDAAGRQWDVAFMTVLSPQAPPGEQKGVKPASVRLELGQVDAQGKLAAAPAAAWLVRLDGPPLLETGCLVELPRTPLVKHSIWEVNEADRPPRTWEVVGLEAAAGVTCVKIVGQQQSTDWDRPRGDQSAWRRRDTVWIHPKLGVAQRVERVIEHRDPLRRDPTRRLVVSYELESPFRYPGRLFEDRKLEITGARKLHEDATALLRQPALYRPQLDTLIKKVSLHLENQAPTPYRKAVFHLAHRLESARRGDTAPAPAVEEVRAHVPVAVGQRVNDFVVSDITGQKSARLSRLTGRPVLVVFYNPSTDIGKDVMLFARGLMQRHGDHVAVMAMAVGVPADLALKQQRELQLPFAILDGKGMQVTFGVQTTPRLVLLDGDGVVRTAHTGWGSHVSREIQDELASCLLK
jgi:peroxiredoxin